MSRVISHQCSACKHFKGVLSGSRRRGVTDGGGLVVCAAFPSGIPSGIARGEFDHTSPHRGDHNIQFEWRAGRAEEV